MSPGVEPDLRYPIGHFAPVPVPLAPDVRRNGVAVIAEFPARLRQAVAGLDEKQLDTAYRPGGWTVRQLVHHVADSHLNSYVRLKLALTEAEPTIKPYDEKAWADLPDSQLDVETSLRLIDGLHARWAAVLNALTPEQWSRRFQHPERGLMDVDQTLALYTWHSKHHVAHITELRRRMGW